MFWNKNVKTACHTRRLYIWTTESPLQQRALMLSITYPWHPILRKKATFWALSLWARRECHPRRFLKLFWLRRIWAPAISRLLISWQGCSLSHRRPIYPPAIWGYRTLALSLCCCLLLPTQGPVPQVSPSLTRMIMQFRITLHLTTTAVKCWAALINS